MESLRRSMNAPTARAMGVLQKPFSQSEMEGSARPAAVPPPTGDRVVHSKR